MLQSQKIHVKCMKSPMALHRATMIVVCIVQWIKIRNTGLLCDEAIHYTIHSIVITSGTE